MKNRRVGTFTLGLSLITFGIIFLIAIFNKNFNAMDALQFAPVFLIILGIEILIYAFVAKDEKLRYDGVSIFLSVIIIISSVIGSSIPIAYNTVFKENRLENKYSDQLERQVRNALEEKYNSFDVHSSVDVYDTKNLGEKYVYNKDDLYSAVYINFYDEEKSAEDFANKIIEVRKLLEKNNVSMSTINLNGRLSEVSGESVSVDEYSDFITMDYRSDYSSFKTVDFQSIVSRLTIS